MSLPTGNDAEATDLEEGPVEEGTEEDQAGGVFSPEFAPVVPIFRRDIPTIDLTDLVIDVTAATLIPHHFAVRHGMIGIAFEGDVLVVALSDPGNIFAIDDVRTLTGREVKVVQANAVDIAEALRTIGSVNDPVSGAIAAAEEELPDEDVGHGSAVEDAPIIRLVNMVIGRAVGARASDIHLEPNEADIRVRYRIDGVLHEQMRLSRSLHAGMVSRIKIISEMDIAERRLPQDGRAIMNVSGDVVDLRVATLPTMHGEKVVIRILDKSNAALDLDELGLSEHTYRRFTSAFKRPQGMLLVTGPTGSGKTTTLYAALNALNDPDRSIITVEDPVEYGLPGAYQIQVHAKAGLSFAAALRSILRSDPDIILVGEIRDRETAQLAIDAALTGHLVLSSLHTNDAASAVARLTEMGVESFLVASAVQAVLGQRLVRMLCDKCKEPYEPSDELLAEAGIPPGPAGSPLLLMRPVGCSRCGNTGYRGRTGVHETMLMNETIERMTVDRRTSDEITRAAVKSGMRTLGEDAIEKVMLGITSIEEVLRVVGSSRAAFDEFEERAEQHAIEGASAAKAARQAEAAAPPEPSPAPEVEVTTTPAPEAPQPPPVEPAPPAKPEPAEDVPAAASPGADSAGGVSWQVGKDGKISIKFGS